MQSFMGTINFVRRFVLDFAQIVKPLQQMVKQSVQFKWNDLEKNTFNKIKTSIAHTHYYISIQNPTEKSDGAWISLFKPTKNHKDTFFL